jgi:TPP-dependent 2-oxoacid decarboxylase
MLDKIKKLLGVKTKEPRPQPPSEAAPKPKKERKSRKKASLSDKELADKNGEPYVSIIKVHIDPNDINNGAFELDFNQKFVVNLIKQGYKIKPDDTDNEIVDRWFQTVCRNVALEVYEQEVADPEKRVRSDIRVVQQKDLGNGRTEIS